MLCGIFAYTGSEKASPIICKGLKCLEYRGYDSVGLAVVSGGLEMRKDVGKIDDLMVTSRLEEIEGKTGIGHTRWATHGPVTSANSHPHADCTGKIAIIHNGIIENHHDLREHLIERGHRFASDTDSEVIAHLIEDRLSEGVSGASWGGFSTSPSFGPFEEACFSAFKELEGSFAVLAVHEGLDKVIGIRKDSPLAVGVSDHATFIASDVSPFLLWTKNVVYLENYDFVVAEKEDVRFYNLLHWSSVKDRFK